MARLMSMLDVHGRPLRDLRISITDRCNFRCTYCMPREHFSSNHSYIPRDDILTYEEIITVVSSLLPLGLAKVRITGGEPLLRRDVTTLISMLRALDENLDIAMTTNGVLLPRYAEAMKESGLSRVTVSLDAVEEDKFASITDSRNTPEDVFAGIHAAQEAGLPVKVNCVVKKGVNEDQIIPLTNACIERNIAVRFIEFMDVGTTNQWNIDAVMSGKEMRTELTDFFGPLKRVKPQHPSDVARMWEMENGATVGFIESVTNPFCGDCSRARLSAHGSLYTCLFSSHGFDLRGMLRFEADIDDIAYAIQDIWIHRNDKYSEERASFKKHRQRVEMSFIGG
ncbi:MAG: GTP 3',8-cyclase MoaA [Euryarchaeota archaeon]|nr:GTP 3',8-cyclase MoaA [Euryarchaeota archaeon]